MKNKFSLSLFGIAFLSSSFVLAQEKLAKTKHHFVLTNPKILESLGIPFILQNNDGNVAFAKVSQAQEMEISELMHKNGRCGGFQLVSSDSNPRIDEVQQSFLFINAISKSASTSLLNRNEDSQINVNFRPEIDAAIKRVDSERVAHWIKWFSSFHTRFHREPNANDFVRELYLGILKLAQESSLKIQVDEITHNQTKQRSVRARILGSEKPNEIVILGGHLDSINGRGNLGSHAPGADDNASGSSNILESFLGVIKSEIQPKRTIEFFWYAGEEGGLIGSTEIAKSYRKQGIDVIGAMQLDMTLFPGNGEFVMTSVEDFTSPVLRKYLDALNNTYTQYKFIAGERCGYACSDHASWTSQGFPSVYPFESTTETMNRNLHTVKDVFSESSSAKHSAAFAKLSLAFVLDLSMSDFRP